MTYPRPIFGNSKAYNGTAKAVPFRKISRKLSFSAARYKPARRRFVCIAALLILLLASGFGQQQNSQPVQSASLPSKAQDPVAQESSSAAAPATLAPAGTAAVAAADNPSIKAEGKPSGAAAQGDTTDAYSPALIARTQTVPIDDRYHIGPDDVLDIRLFDRPELTREGVRVDGAGMVRMPFIGEIKAACKTTAEFSDELARRYQEYLKNPQVDVSVKEFSSAPVLVVGAISKPGNFQLQRRVRLRELLGIAGGPTVLAGDVVQIVPDESAQLCATDNAAGANSGVVVVNMTNLLRGTDNVNPFLRPGDLVNIPEAAQVYVVGNVAKPGPFALKGQLTVSRAVAMAGGSLTNSTLSKVRIIRQLSGRPGNRELLVDLRAIEKGNGEDLVLQAGDIVDVPTSFMKMFVKTFFASVVTTAASYYPLTAIR